MQGGDANRRKKGRERCDETGRWHWMLTGDKVEKLMGSDSSGSVLEVWGGAVLWRARSGS